MSHKSKDSSKTLDKEEEKYQLVDTIKQSILDRAFIEIYENYLEKQTVYFVSHCSELAWKALVRWQYQRKDKGGFKDLDTDLLDVEPETSQRDSWAAHSVLVGKGELPTVTTVVKEKLQRSFEEECTVSHKKISDSSSRHQKRLSNAEERKDAITKARKVMQQKKCMKTNKSDEYSGEIRGTKSVDLKKESYELPSPIVLQPKLFPSSTVKVIYEVTSGTREFLSRKKPRMKTINLRGTKDPAVNLEDCKT